MDTAKVLQEILDKTVNFDIGALRGFIEHKMTQVQKAQESAPKPFTWMRVALKKIEHIYAVQLPVDTTLVDGGNVKKARAGDFLIIGDDRFMRFFSKEEVTKMTEGMDETKNRQDA